MINKTLETSKWIQDYSRKNNVPILAYVGDMQSDACGFILENMDGKNAEQFCKLMVTHYDILLGIMAMLNKMPPEELIQIHNAFNKLVPDELGKPS